MGSIPAGHKIDGVRGYKVILRKENGTFVIGRFCANALAVKMQSDTATKAEIVGLEFLYQVKAKVAVSNNVTGPKDKKIKKIIIPDTVTIGTSEYKVTGIAENAFKNYKKLTSVTIGNFQLNISAAVF
ncbi:hypothetical protein [Butyrivibrio sp. INlla16]|uniref:hypothetical protein n=1 Tax=Butyrivibrio sp. INlla16 TaxID=1520807 RepID=UPI0008883C0D|nr:hypothetical protein [Butyrivibrio sp. INlla16]SDB68803.1 hypothetical protein SAMN02910263_04288 [Butyrivibrio sp. INlla16]